MSLGRLLMRRGTVVSSGLVSLEHSCITGPSTSSLSMSTCSLVRPLGGGRAPSKFYLPTTTSLNVEFRRGVKTTDTTHPQPIYDEDEKILKKVMEERSKCEDLPIGMDNPYEKPKKICILCENGITPSYKNVKLLYQFVSPYTGMTYERHITGLCKRKQGEVVKQITIANNLSLMSNYVKPVEFLKDPKLCDPERPFRPHKH